jgi:uncharacterized protein
MKWITLFAIRVYWVVIPKKYRKGCLFKESCSHFVYRTTKEHGFTRGLVSFFQRKKRCKPGYKIVLSQSSSEIILADGSLLPENEFSEIMVHEVINCRFFLSGK